MSPATQPRIVVIGSINIDYVMRASRLPRPGETVTADELTRTSGGKGANQAVAAARLGARVDFIARAARTDNALFEELHAEHIDTSSVALDDVRSTGVAHITVDEHGEKIIVVHPGANAALSVEDVDAATDVIARADVVMLQLEIPMTTVMHALRTARSAGVRTMLDAAPPVALTNELIALVDVLRMNRSEATAISGIEVSDDISARRAAHALLERGAALVALQTGSRSNLIATHQEEIILPYVDVRCVDATGAGDAFCAGLAVRIAEGASLRDAGAFASAAAALATTDAGARSPLPRRENVDELVRTRLVS